jgi:hypothetical protein
MVCDSTMQDVLLIPTVKGMQLLDGPIQISWSLACTTTTTAYSFQRTPLNTRMVGPGVGCGGLQVDVVLLTGGASIQPENRRIARISGTGCNHDDTGASDHVTLAGDLREGVLKVQSVILSQWIHNR